MPRTAATRGRATGFQGRPAQAGPFLADADETTFAPAFGGDVTVNLNDVCALRVIQPEVLFTWFGGSTQTNFRTSAGLVFRVG